MRRENILLVALLIVLSSCQKKAEVEQAPAEQAVKPAAAEVPAVQLVVEAPAKAQSGNVSSEVSPKPVVVIVAGKLEMPPLAKKNNCTACHAIDHKVVGPAWMDVSKAYNSNGTTTTGKKVADILKEHNAKTPEEWLVQKVSKGGTGNWGTAAMIANDPKGTKQADIKELVEFVLGLVKN